LEVQDFERLTDGTLVYTMGLNINLQSMTIEEVLAVRKKQCRELAAVVGRSLERERDEASAQEGAQRLAGLLHGAREGAQRLAGLLHGAREEARAIEARDGAWFNENSNFVACVHTLVPSPPFLQAAAAPSSAAVRVASYPACAPESESDFLPRGDRQRLCKPRRCSRRRCARCRTRSSASAST
jgi:hypothetical protein